MAIPTLRTVLLPLLLAFLAACAPRPTPAAVLPAVATASPVATAIATAVAAATADRATTVIPPPTTIPSLTPTARQMASAAATTSDLPAEHYIRAITGHKQYFTLGCETATAKDWANFFGFDFNEFEFQYRLPLSDNPDYGFVGDVNSPWGQVPPYAYGVYAGPVADLLNDYGIPAKAYKGYTLEQIIAKVSQDKPVIAWVIGNVVGGVPYEYTDKEGRKVTVAAYEHVVIITGYNETKLRYMTNGKFFETPKEVFLNSWSVLGNMVVVDK